MLSLRKRRRCARSLPRAQASPPRDRGQRRLRFFYVLLRPGETAKIPTGIRARIADGWFLAIFPRSGLGFKYRLQLNNTVGVVDSDYYRSDNEGHIFVKITNDSKEGKILELPAGSGFAQGIFLPFGITEDDEAEGVRNGGFGSTGK